MEANCNNLTERILQLTLEIIYLLTGEDDIVAKKTMGRKSMMVPLHSLLVPKRNNEQKILEVTQKIIDLLTGEIGNWSNFNVIIKEELEEEDGAVEKKSSKGHKDLYKDIMIEHQTPSTSLDGPSKRNPPERRPRPLYSRNPTQEHHSTPRHDPGIEVIEIKTEAEEEEMDRRENQLSQKEAEMVGTVSKNESSPDNNTGAHNGWNSPGGRHISSEDYNKDDNGMAPCSPGVSIVTRKLYQRPKHMGKSTDWFNTESTDKSHTVMPNVFHSAGSPDPSNPEQASQKNLHSFQDFEKSFIKKHYLVVHHKFHTSEKPFWCFECEKSFTRKSNLIDHQKIHTSEKPFSCSECGKSFIKKSHLIQHQRIHTGEKPFSCFECGKCFSDKGNCDRHIRSHFSVQNDANVMCRK